MGYTTNKQRRMMSHTLSESLGRRLQEDTSNVVNVMQSSQVVAETSVSGVSGPISGAPQFNMQGCTVNMTVNNYQT